MGVFKHNDIFSTKYLTALIRDSQDRAYSVFIKSTLDDYFITRLNGAFYAFSLEGARIITFRLTAVKTFRFVDYDTTHYKSIQYDKLEELKLFLVKNRLPRMNMLQFKTIQLLGRKERKKELVDIKNAKDAISNQEDEGKKPEEIKVPPHDMHLLLEELQANREQDVEGNTNLINYVRSLDIDTIVTPCQKISDYIEDDLVSTKPTFLGELMPRIERLLGKHGEIVNSPYTAKNAWLMKIMILMFIIVGVVAIAWMANEGYFDSITGLIPDTSSFQGVGDAFKPNFPQAETNPCTDEALQAKYTPEALKIAVDSGNETCELSPFMQDLVDGVELPKVEPIQNDPIPVP